MGVSIYIRNKSVEICQSTQKKNDLVLSELIHEEIGEGLVLNGVIISGTGLAAELRRIWETYDLETEGINLALSDGQFSAKQITIPRTREKKIFEIIAREFGELENLGAYLFDYHIISEDKKNKNITIFCVAVLKTTIESYKKVFQLAELPLESIDESLNCQLKAYARSQEKKGQNYLVLNLDGMTLNATLFIKGEYKYFQRNRMFTEVGSPEFATEIARTVSAIQQFQSAKDKEEVIQFVEIGGIPSEKRERIVSLLGELGMKEEEALVSEITPLPLEEKIHRTKESGYYNLTLSNYGNLIGLAYKEKKDLNFIKRLEQEEKEQKGGSKTNEKERLIVLGILLGACALLSLFLFAWNALTQYQIEKVLSYVNDEENIRIYQQVEMLEDQTNGYLVRINSLTSTADLLESYPLATSEVEAELNRSANGKVDISIESYDAATGDYNFVAKAPIVTDIYDFVEGLASNGTFVNLQYSGYNYIQGEDKYHLRVTGKLSETAGK